MSTKSGEQSADVAAKHLDLCRQLNMDKDTENLSWKNYLEISENFTLEGDPVHWLCCALYSECRESFTPTVGNSNSVVKGNCVSLTKLLRSCNISIYEFFNKIKKWIDMANLSQNFRNQVDRLERSFGVSLVLYKKYTEIFEKLFVLPLTEKKNKKAKPIKCSSSKLYDFCWCLFLCAKGEDPKHTVDLVTSFNLLLCCIDLIFANALADNRRDLIRTDFAGLPSNLNSSDFDPKTVTPFCIMESLCKLHDVAYIEAMKMKNYSWKSLISNYIKNQNIRGNMKSFMEIISNANFEPNFKSLNNIYEQYVLSVGEFDERIFLSNASFRKSNSGGDTDAEREKQFQINASIRSLVPGTPLTRRHHLPTKDISEPVASATQNVKKLQVIAEMQNSKEFLSILGDTKIKLESRLRNMCDTFCKKYPTKEKAEERFKLARGLYFNLLEKIVRIELKSKPMLDPKILLDSDVFHVTLIACCVEIVIVAYNSQIKFPWILECFDLHAFHFYKIIEIVVLRHEDAMTRFIIIQLNSIEERCLDSLVWKTGSPLWDAIRQWEGPLPSWCNVESKSCNYTTNFRRSENSNLERNLLQSPVNSAYEYFNQSTITESARRDLFNACKDKVSGECSQNVNEATLKKPGKAGSVLLFFRKFYKLAYMRISELCRELSMKNDEYLNHIWTLFEYSIVEQTELMRDRHLDQMLMCAIYVFIKVKDITEKTFTDIMKFYRNQPQATSNIYRHVLIKPGNQDTEPPQAPQYGDIIQFYNSVYVQKMTPYALSFGDKSKSQSQLLLSPRPPERLMSPRKISGNIYIQPLEKKEIPQAPNPLTYEFCKSPAKDLQRINQLVKSGKRTLPFSDNDADSIMTNKMSKTVISGPRATCISRKIHGIIRDRQEEEIKE